MAVTRIQLANHRETMRSRFSRGTYIDYLQQYKHRQQEEESILQAAILMVDGTIYTVERPGHHAQIWLLLEAYRKNSPEHVKEEGFVTNHGQYFNCHEALTIAEAADQWRTQRPPGLALRSQDLW